MSAIFLSHAVADHALAHMLTNFLKEAVGVRQADLFVSSVDGHGIPFGENFNTFIKNQIQAPKLVICLLTPSYMESAFCLMELGATWAKSHTTLPVVVPPVDFDFIMRTLGPTQGWMIKSPKGLTQLKLLVEGLSIDLEQRTLPIFEEKKERWILDIDHVVSELPAAKKVDAKTHKDLQDDLEDRKAKILALESARKTDAEKISALESAKDATEVAAIRKNFEGAISAQDRFDEIITAVRRGMPAQAARVVQNYLFMHYFDKSPDIDWYYDKSEFQSAINYNIVGGPERQYAPLWDKQKLRALGAALSSLNEFLASEEASAFVEAQAAEGIPMEADDLEFWERHYFM